MREYGFETIAELDAKLRAVHYVPTREILVATFFSARKHRPLIAEGPAGVGKTELARAMARVMATDLIRLQCVPGLNIMDAIGEFDTALQATYAQLKAGGMSQLPTMGELKEWVYQYDSLVHGPLLQSILRERPAVLLIDELDKIDEKCEAAFLQFLEDWAVSIPKLKTTITARSIPLVIITSNAQRSLSHPLLRRSNYIWVSNPAPCVAAQILRERTAPSGPYLNYQLVAIAHILNTNQLEKPVSISELMFLKECLADAGIERVRVEHASDVISMLLKTEGDRGKVLGIRGQFQTVLDSAARVAERYMDEDAVEQWRLEYGSTGGDPAIMSELLQRMEKPAV